MTGFASSTVAAPCSSSPATTARTRQPGPDLRAISALLGAQVSSALARLSHVQREVLVLAYWGGYTQREIALIDRRSAGNGEEPHAGRHEAPARGPDRGRAGSGHSRA